LSLYEIFYKNIIIPIKQLVMTLTAKQIRCT